MRANLPSFCTQGAGILAAECNGCYSTASQSFTTRSDVLYGRVGEAGSELILGPVDGRTVEDLELVADAA